MPGTPIVTPLDCSLDGMQIEVMISAGSRLESIYGARTATERTTCNYGLEPTHAHLASEFGMRVAAVDNTNEVRAIEREEHPFFMATLYQPQLTTAPGTPHPLWRAFVNATAAFAR
jgi:CTP synthase (UTP-ammonia lyase)